MRRGAAYYAEVTWGEIERIVLREGLRSAVYVDYLNNVPPYHIPSSTDRILVYPDKPHDWVANPYMYELALQLSVGLYVKTRLPDIERDRLLEHRLTSSTRLWDTMDLAEFDKWHTLVREIPTMRYAYIIDTPETVTLEYIRTAVQVLLSRMRVSGCDLTKCVCYAHYCERIGMINKWGDSDVAAMGIFGGIGISCVLVLHFMSDFNVREDYAEIQEMVLSRINEIVSRESDVHDRLQV